MFLEIRNDLIGKVWLGFSLDSVSLHEGWVPRGLFGGWGGILWGVTPMLTESVSLILSVIMLDEAHERTLYTDIAIGLLKKVWLHCQYFALCVFFLYCCQVRKVIIAIWKIQEIQREKIIHCPIHSEKNMRQMLVCFLLCLCLPACVYVLTQWDWIMCAILYLARFSITSRSFLFIVK